MDLATRLELDELNDAYDAREEMRQRLRDERADAQAPDALDEPPAPARGPLTARSDEDA